MKNELATTVRRHTTAIKDGAGRSAKSKPITQLDKVAHGVGPNRIGDGVMVTESLVTVIVTARRPLLVKPTVLGVYEIGRAHV